MTLARAANGLLYPTDPALAAVGAPRDLTPVTRDEVGAAWYRAPVREAGFGTGRTISLAAGRRRSPTRSPTSGPGDTLALAPGEYRLAAPLAVRHRLTLAGPRRRARRAARVSGARAHRGGRRTAARTSRHRRDRLSRRAPRWSTSAAASRRTIASRSTTCRSVVPARRHGSTAFAIAPGTFADAIAITDSRFADMATVIAASGEQHVQWLVSGGAAEHRGQPFRPRRPCRRPAAQGHRRKHLRSALRAHRIERRRQWRRRRLAAPVRRPARRHRRQQLHPLGAARRHPLGRHAAHADRRQPLRRHPRAARSTNSPTRGRRAHSCRTISWRRADDPYACAAARRGRGACQPSRRRAAAGRARPAPPRCSRPRSNARRATSAASIRAGIDVPVPKDPGGGFTHEQHKRNYRAIFEGGQLYPADRRAPLSRPCARPAARVCRALSHARTASRRRQPGPGPALLAEPERQRLARQRDAGLRRDPRRPDAGRAPAHRRRADPADGAVPVRWIARGVQPHPQPCDLGRARASGLPAICSATATWSTRRCWASTRAARRGFLRQLDLLFSPDGYYAEGPYYQRYALQPFVVFAAAIAGERARPRDLRLSRRHRAEGDPHGDRRDP